ncbi:MAG: RNA polymerase sigma factor [Deltaproteobacteria bacterium]
MASSNSEPKVIELRPRAAERPVSDEALIVACGLGDESALVQLFERHKDFVHRYLYRFFPRDPEYVEDLVQSTFLEVWRCAPRFRNGSAGRTFIVGIATNLSRMRRRGEARRRRAMDALAAEPQRAGTTPEERAVVGQRVRRLEAAIATLSEKQREVFVLCDLEGFSGGEAAETLGIRPGAVWRRLHDARKKLRAALREDER